MLGEKKAAIQGSHGRYGSFSYSTVRELIGRSAYRTRANGELFETSSISSPKERSRYPNVISEGFPKNSLVDRSQIRSKNASRDRSRSPPRIVGRARQGRAFPAVPVMTKSSANWDARECCAGMKSRKGSRLRRKTVWGRYVGTCVLQGCDPSVLSQDASPSDFEKVRAYNLPAGLENIVGREDNRSVSAKEPKASNFKVLNKEEQEGRLGSADLHVRQHAYCAHEFGPGAAFFLSSSTAHLLAASSSFTISLDPPGLTRPCDMPV
ncbi:hypothetical protein NMY22_g18034 [Coprinellus aureogranulatus]|nr:hypothetical protein NMY22_g18034 [Coprinellus aureogranulatus]